MGTNEEIEMMLWEYMDGTCNEPDKQRISVLIEQDETWKAKYAELSAFNADLANSLHLEQPSLRFSKNVMEAVATVKIAPATKMYINKNIIRGIAAFFILTVTTLLGYALATADWSANSTSVLSKLNLDKFDMSRVFNSTTFNLVIAVNVIIALVLLDTMLRRKRNQHNTANEQLS
jgi:hypothetical protein